MARIECIVSDLSGGKNATEVEFNYGAQRYVIALTGQERHNLKRLTEAMDKRFKKYLDVATPATQMNKNGNGKTKTSVVREWALERGYDVPSRGRLPDWVWESYRKAMY